MLYKLVVIDDEIEMDETARFLEGKDMYGGNDITIDEFVDKKIQIQIGKLGLLTKRHIVGSGFMMKLDLLFV